MGFRHYFTVVKLNIFLGWLLMLEFELVYNININLIRDLKKY